ncbi:MAG: folate family ECF transporter S component [Tissierellaceae bacterium]
MMNNRISTGTLTQAGFLTAISIVLTRFVSVMVPLAGGLPALRLGFGEIPIMMAGLLFGPVVGGISGMIADLIGAFTFPQGPYFPGFTLSSILWGVLPGIYSLYLAKKSDSGNIFTFKRVLFIAIAVTIPVSLILNTYWLSIMMGKGFLVLLPGRLLSDIVKVPLESYFIAILIKHLRTRVAL